MRHGLDVPKALRQATATQHAAVEAQPCFAALMSKNVSRADILRAIQVFHTHYSTWEPAIHACLKGIAPNGLLERRERLPALREDLRRHGVSLTHTNYGKRTLDFAHALGWLYVHEGSSHGALIIQKHLKQYAGEAVAREFPFFGGYGKETSKMWSETLEWIAQQVRDHVCLEHAIEGAQTAFTELSATAERHLVVLDRTT